MPEVGRNLFTRQIVLSFRIRLTPLNFALNSFEHQSKRSPYPRDRVPNFEKRRQVDTKFMVCYTLS